MRRGASCRSKLAPLASWTRYRVHAFAKAWQYIPAAQVTFAGPQAHVAFACCSVRHGDRVGLAICPFASASPTDMAVASSAIEKVLNMICPPFRNVSLAPLRLPLPCWENNATKWQSAITSNFFARLLRICHKVRSSIMPPPLPAALVRRRIGRLLRRERPRRPKAGVCLL
jgi:hypothetical protein